MSKSYYHSGEGLLKKMNTECKYDLNRKHCWEKLGVCFDGTKWKNRIYLIWRCTQCKKCLVEDLSFLDEDKK